MKTQHEKKTSSIWFYIVLEKFKYLGLEYKYKYKYLSLKYKYKYKYLGLEYKYKYKYFSLEYKYKYKYHKVVLELYSSTSTSTKYYSSVFQTSRGLAAVTAFGRLDYFLFTAHKALLKHC